VKTFSDNPLINNGRKIKNHPNPRRRASRAGDRRIPNRGASPASWYTTAGHCADYAQLGSGKTLDLRREELLGQGQATISMFQNPSAPQGASQRDVAPHVPLLRPHVSENSGDIAMRRLP
jgi:hypothetical protein